MSYLTQSLRNAYDARDRGELERLLVKVDVMEREQEQRRIVQQAGQPVPAPEDAGFESRSASQSAWAQVTPK